MSRDEAAARIHDLVAGGCVFDLHDRRTTLGASEAPAVLGQPVHRFSSAHGIWMAKRGIVPDEDLSELPQIQRGTFGESMILEEYARRNPAALFVETSRVTMFHPTIPWASASPDGMTAWPSGVVSLVEAKWPGSRMLDEWGDPDSPRFEGPDRYRFQGVWQMMVTGVRSFVDFILPWDLDSWEFRTYRLVWREEDERRILEAATDFWDRCVMGGQEPDLDGSDDADAWIAHRYPTAGSKGDRVDLTDDPEAEDLAIEHRRLKLEIEALELRRKKIGQALKAKIGPHYGAKIGGLVRSASFYESSNTSVRWDELARDCGIDADTIDRYTKRSRFRVLKLTYSKDADDMIRGTIEERGDRQP